MKDMPPQVAKKIGKPVTTAVLSLRRWVGAARRSSCRRDHICTKGATNNEPETVGSVVASCDCGYRALLPRGHGSRVRRNARRVRKNVATREEEMPITHQK